MDQKLTNIVAQANCDGCITDYEMLTAIPDVRTGPKTGEINEFTGYIPNLFLLLIGLTAVFAVVQIIWGGIEYITTDSWQSKDEGKKRIKNAIIGLLLIISAWLILNTINPKLLSLTLTIDTPLTATSTAVTGGGGAGCANCKTLEGFAFKTGAGQTGTAELVAGLNELRAATNLTGQLIITDAYNPGGPHVAGGCHGNGSCVDTAFGSGKTNANIATVISKSNQISSLAATYEIPTVKAGLTPAQAEARKAELVKAGVPAKNILINSAATGEHFHIYQCGGGVNTKECAYYK